MRRLLLILCGTLLLVSCRKDDRLVDLVAEVADQPARGGAKVYVDDERYACWHHGDAVNINGTNYSLSVEPGTGHKVAKILRVEESNVGYTAGFPTTYVTGISAGGTTATATVPSVQTYSRATVFDNTGDSYQQLVNPMVAYCSNEDSILKFHNVACVLKIKVTNSTGYDLNMHYVTLTASSAYLAGLAPVSGIGTAAPAMGMPTSGYHDITVDCNSTPIALNNGDDTVIYVVSAPFEDQTLTLRVLAKDPAAASHGDTVYYTLVGTSATTLSLNRNQMGEVEFEYTDCGCAEETGRCDYLFWGCGTEPNPFLITCKEDLVRLRDIVDYMSPYNTAAFTATYNTASVYYLQIMDIALNESTWGSHGTENYPIGIQYYKGSGTNQGVKTHPFLANYNGGGHSVTMNTNLTGTDHGASYPVALFGVVGSTSSTNYLKNLTIKGYVRGTYHYHDYAGLVGYLVGNTNVINCVNEATVSNDKSDQGGVVGGICAMVGYYKHTGNSTGSFEGAGTVTFQNCVNKGTVMNASTKRDFASSPASRLMFNGTGGIVGDVAKGTSCTFDNCCNESSGTVSTSSSKYIGGIIGMSKDLSPTFTGTNINKGSVVATDRSYVGGIMGYSDAAFTIAAPLRNEGTVSGHSSLGGIIGFANSAVTIAAGLTNTTDASVLGTDAASSYVGGIIGYANTPPVLSSGVSIVNEGSVTGYGYMGGVFGYVKGALELNGTLTNRGVVSTVEKSGVIVGGICGHCLEATVDSKATVNNFGRVESGGSITCSTSNTAARSTSATGGVIGLCTQFTNNGIVENGTGAVVRNTKSKHDVGGVVGLCSTLKDCTGNGSFVCNPASSITTHQDSVFGGDNVGGVVGYVKGDFKIRKVGSNIGTVTNGGKVRGVNYVGGLVGRTYATDSINGTATNNGTVIATTAYAGGLIGYTNSWIYVRGSVNNAGTVSCTGSGYVGGIVGQANNLLDISVTGTASNTGEIVGGNNVGGIVGYGNGAFVATAPTNSGIIRGTAKVGGICGYMKNNVTITNASNGNAVTGSTYVAGIVSCCEGVLSLTNCTNNANSTITGNTQVGGIVGAARNVTITSCINNSDVACSLATAGQAKGGIVGQLDNTVGTSYIRKCRNSGNIYSGLGSGYESRLGGMVGFLYPSNKTNLYIEDCSNTGDVRATNNGKINGGLLGLSNRLGSGSNTITVQFYNCYCSGVVKGGEFTGGLVGKCNVGSFYLVNCYFNGKVNSTYASSTALGHVHATAALTNCYICDTTGRADFYRVNVNYTAPPTNSSWFKTASNPGDLITSVTVDASSYSSLGDALRAWQTANPTYTAWTSGTVPTLNY